MSLDDQKPSHSGQYIRVQPSDVAAGELVHICVRAADGQKLFDISVVPPVSVAVTYPPKT